MTSARLSGTPAASKLESNRVKFSSAFAETFFASNLKDMFPGDLGVEPFLGLEEAFSDKFTGRKPSVSIWRNASGRPGASRTPSAMEPLLCNARYENVGILIYLATAMLPGVSAAAFAAACFAVVCATSLAVV